MKKLFLIASLLMMKGFAANAAVTMNENVRGTNNAYFENVVGSTPSFISGSTWTVVATSASLVAGDTAGTAGNVFGACFQFATGGYQCTPSLVSSSSTIQGNFIQNRSSLQSGATAYPDFLYVGSSATLPNLSAASTKIIQVATGTVFTDAVNLGQIATVQVVTRSSSSAAGTATTSTSFVDTFLSTGIVITAGNSVALLSTCRLSITAASDSAFLTFKRDSTDLGDANGMSQYGAFAALAQSITAVVAGIDTPPTTNPVYTVRIKTAAGATTLTFGSNTVTCYLQATEIQSTRIKHTP